MNNRLLLPAILGCLAVLFGAFGAHALEARLSARSFEVWGTANRYHFLHTLSILALELASLKGLSNTRYASNAWALGIVIFAGGLYTYSLTGLKFFAMIAPIGGLTLAAGWLLLLKVRES